MIKDLAGQILFSAINLQAIKLNPHQKPVVSIQEMNIRGVLALGKKKKKIKAVSSLI